ncbi:hypothetical protein P7F88_20035 [Vibrio hannami]|uniref:hypothetical protein n=1 Tax=Vibrio hannami TaxID=2717094 RepID=UPI00241075C7|nr:hypothetical protein [Vibrio hannami]MDG3088235.1 hypothetical protein [Vibrio hannami]
MQCYSKIEVWYKVSGDRILLGETSSNKRTDVISLWVSLPFDTTSSQNEGYELTLVDDDGKQIGAKKVTPENAEIVLGKRQKLELTQMVNEFACLNSYALTT